MVLQKLTQSSFSLLGKFYDKSAGQKKFVNTSSGTKWSHGKFLELDLYNTSIGIDQECGRLSKVSFKRRRKKWKKMELPWTLFLFTIFTTFTIIGRNSKKS